LALATRLTHGTSYFAASVLQVLRYFSVGALRELPTTGTFLGSSNNTGL